MILTDTRKAKLQNLSPLQENSFLPVSESYGLGVEPNWQVLGDPVFECAI